MFGEINPWLAGGGLALGVAFGVIAQWSRFCVVAAVSNVALMRDFRQLSAYLAAVGIAVAGTFLLEWSQLVPIADTGFRRPALNWIGALGGGLIFGVGSMLAGGCASRTLIRSAEGNIGALLTLLTFALASMGTLFGVLGPLREWVLARAVTIPAGDASLSVILGWHAWALPVGISLGCLAVVLRLARSRDYLGALSAGSLIGLLVVAGWWVTGVLAHDDFDPLPPSSLAVAGPLARSAAWLSVGWSTGTAFSLALIPGALLGALAAAVVAGEFHWIPPASDRVGAYLGGGALMGFGAAMAGGCNIGQGLTGLATLSATSLLAVAGIFAGMSLGLFWVSRSTALTALPTH
ncbi:MAG: YeeE/YedE family protein [Chromatiaceae bacterium]|jgi:uncharacterized membrane protein YedE/YeeE|nr:YeeE/YedE family protein [Chromatiaceae bacterium]